MPGEEVDATERGYAALPDPVLIGRVAGIYGVHGWLRVFSYTEPRTGILDYSPWYLLIDGNWQPRGLYEGRAQGKGIVAHIEGCSDRDQAARLLETDIAVSRSQLPPTRPGEFYWNDLQGLMVITVTGEELGRIDHLFATGANDVIVVRGDRERLIPFIWEEVVREVDLEAGRMQVDWDPDAL